MFALRLFLVGLLALSFADRAAAQTTLDLIPEDAVVSLAIRGIDDLIKKGDVFLKEADIHLPIRPSQLFDEGAKILGIVGGLDRKAPAAVVLMPPLKKEEFGSLRWLETSLVPTLPFTDADIMAGNFGVAKGKLLPRVICKTEKRVPLDGYLTRSDKHIYLSESETTLQRVLKSKSLADTLDPTVKRQFGQSDVLLQFGRFAWQQAPDFAKDFVKPGDDPQHKALLEEFVAALKEVQNALIGLRLREGIDGRFWLTVPRDGKAARLLNRLRNKGAPSTVAGLPEGNVLLAQASSGDPAQRALLARVFFDFLLEDLLIKQKIVHEVDRFTYLGVSQEILRQLQGHRIAVYQNADEKKHGLFSAVAVLDTEDAKRFLGDMRLLAKMATAESIDLAKPEVKEEIDIDRLVRDLGSPVYAVRQSAQTRLLLIGQPAAPILTKAIDSGQLDLESLRRARLARERIQAVAAQRRKELLDDKNRPFFDGPQLTYIAGAEKRRDLPVDVIRIKLAGVDQARTKKLTDLLGPDWHNVRLAIVGKQIVAVLGSDVSLFEAATRNLQQSEPGLASSKRLAAFQEACPPERQFELHASVEGLLRLVAPDAKLDAPVQLTSVGLVLSGNSLQIVARVPSAEVRAIARKAQDGLR
jgi:hypothetical protein